MFAIHSGHGQISKSALLNSSSFLLRLLHNSANSASTDIQPHFMVDYLIDSLGFTQQEAISASSKVRHLKSTKKSQSVIDFLRNYNLSNTQIKFIVLSQPNILLRKVDKTLEPKFKILSELGFSVPDLVYVISRDPNLLNRSLNKSIAPTINLLMRILGSRDKIVKAIKKSLWPFYGKYFKSNVVLLEQYGVLGKDIERIILRKPGLVTQSPVNLQQKLVQLEREFGMAPDSSMFSYGLSGLCSISKLNLQKKFDLFKSFGWCDSEIFTIAKSQPLCFTHSEERLRKGLNFYMKELGFTSSWLSSRGSLLMYNLEKRVKPRYQIHEILKEKGVMVKEFHSMLWLSNMDFAKKVVQAHKEELPNHLYESFTKNIKQ